MVDYSLACKYTDSVSDEVYGVIGVDDAFAKALDNPGLKSCLQLSVGACMRDRFQQAHVARWIEKMSAEETLLVFFWLLFNNVLKADA